MPFTGSHPAAVLPLLRSRLPASALLIGSMAPDLPYYLPWRAGPATHTAVGVVTVDLALGAAGWALWHGLLSAPALATAPAGVRRRLAGRARTGLVARLGSPGSVVRVAAGLVVGAATHVFWDEFTHPRRWGAEHVGVLGSVWHGRPGYSWAQDVSGLVGATVLLSWSARWWRRTTAVPGPDHEAATVWPWALVAAAALAGATTAPGDPDPREAAAMAAFHAGGAGALAAALLAVGWHARNRSDPAR